MTRPLKKRRIRFKPGATFFKPRTVPLSELEEVELDMDEMEALRLCDIKNFDQTLASEKMNVSQSTFQRILESARKKTAEALVEGKAIRVQNYNH